MLRGSEVLGCDSNTTVGKASPKQCSKGSFLHPQNTNHHASYAALGPRVNHLPTIPNDAASERIRHRGVIVLPPEHTANFVTTPNSRMTFEQFWTQVIQPLVNADPVGNKPIIDWWKAATTLNGMTTT